MRARKDPEIKNSRTCSIAKQGVAIIASMAVAVQPMFAYANPQGGVVSAGQATITQSGNTLEVKAIHRPSGDHFSLSAPVEREVIFFAFPPCADIT